MNNRRQRSLIGRPMQRQVVLEVLDVLVDALAQQPLGSQRVFAITRPVQRGAVFQVDGFLTSVKRGKHKTRDI